MTATEFVKSKIDELISRFTNINCRYEYDSFSSTHMVEVMPGHIYKSDVDYAQAETIIIDEFIETFPEESICFISEGSLIEIKNPIYERKGITYDIIKSVILNNWMTIPSLEKFSFNFPYEILEVNVIPNLYTKSILSSFVWTEIKPSASPNLINDIWAFPYSSVLPQFNYKVLSEETEEATSNDLPIEDNYALAA